MSDWSARLARHCQKVVDGLLAAAAQGDLEALRRLWVNFSTCCELALLPALRRVAEQDLVYSLEVIQLSRT